MNTICRPQGSVLAHRYQQVVEPKGLMAQVTQILDSGDDQLVQVGAIAVALYPHSHLSQDIAVDVAWMQELSLSSDEKLDYIMERYYAGD